MANVSFPQREGMLDETTELNAKSVTEKRTEKVVVSSVDHLVTASSNPEEGRQRQPPDNHANESSVRTTTSASSFSVTIEDEIGNLVSISRMNNTDKSDASDKELDVKEDGGKVVLTWQAVKPVKGFVIYRTEKGKKDYLPVTSVIPFVGMGEKDALQYRCIDNGVKPGMKYEYRMEVVGSNVVSKNFSLL